MLQLYGEHGFYESIELAKKFNWQIYDSGIDGMIDLGNPEKNGFKSVENKLNKYLIGNKNGVQQRRV